MAKFSSPEAAEEAFYGAFEAGDPEAMRAVWQDTPDCVCIHPGGERLQGIELVMDSWDDILASMEDTVIRRSGLTVLGGSDLVTHVLHEHLYMGGDLRGMVLATNAYRFDGRSWRMVLHHASPDPTTRSRWNRRSVH
ncbi:MULTISPECIES: nuclear transport factor 2 family protein [unclassified Thioalkalivibrio]|uniref:nuclear transport factor 2 family protein n=1 Tax=unclassified Thioalkalivibrio TaxID=2621013 RepID=UPI00036AF020|nr:MULTISPECIES: nuclear transport factor 2 family protein [unclassified Thioalkalivibrio]